MKDIVDIVVRVNKAPRIRTSSKQKEHIQDRDQN